MLPRHHPFRRTFPCLACIGSSANVKPPCAASGNGLCGRSHRPTIPKKSKERPEGRLFDEEEKERETRAASSAQKHRPPAGCCPLPMGLLYGLFSSMSSHICMLLRKKILILPISAHNIVNIENCVISNSFLFPLTPSPARWYNTCIIRAHAGSSSFWHPAREEFFHDIR